VKNLSRVEDARKLMAQATTYEEWAEAARNHDLQSGMAEWREREASSLYDFGTIRLRLQKLRSYRRNGDDKGLLFSLNEGIHGNMGRMGNQRLYSKALFGTKRLIEDYIEEIADSLHYLADLDSEEISFEERLDFFQRASHCFGRSALMLSGGAALGNFHIGVLKSLVEQNLLPNVISGASAGALFAAMAGTNDAATLAQYFNPDNLITAARNEASLVRRLWDGGYKKIDRDAVIENINKLVPDLTFEEAFNRTGRHVNIAISPYERHQQSRLLNALTSPNVLIRSAVLASAAVPGIFPPVTLMAKNKDGETQPYLPSRKWIDGSFSDDLPAKRLARLYGVNHYIVSLTNPFVLPFAVDPADSSEVKRVTSRFVKMIAREYANVGRNLTQKYLKKYPRIESSLTLFYSILAQNYTGNINIVHRLALKDVRRLLTHVTPEEMMQMISQGERVTWPKVEQIRISTRVGRVLDDILTDYEQKERAMAKVGMIIKRKADPEKSPVAV